MKNKYLGIGIVLIVIVIAGGVLLFMGNGKTQSTQQSGNKQNTQNQTQTTPTTQQQKTLEADVKVTNAGFEPQTIKIKTGTEVVWLNESDQPVSVNSDVHPTHLLWPFLNLGSFDKGSTVGVIFEKAGTYTYHNHFKPEEKGTVIVE